MTTGRKARDAPQNWHDLAVGHRTFLQGLVMYLGAHGAHDETTNKVIKRLLSQIQLHDEMAGRWYDT